VPYGTIDRTDTQSKTFGGSCRRPMTTRYSANGNHFVVGGSIDNGNSAFNANSTLGFISPDLVVGINPAIPGNGSIIHTAGNVGYTPVGINTKNTYYGLYFTDTFDITERLAATAVGATMSPR